MADRLKTTKESWEKPNYIFSKSLAFAVLSMSKAGASDKQIVSTVNRAINQLLAKQREEMIEGLNDNYWLARVFHNECEGLAERYGWKTNKKTRVRFEDLPDENLKLMLATCKLVLWHIRAKLKTNTTKEEK